MNFHYYKRVYYTPSCGVTSWNMFRYACVCVFLSEGRIQLKASYLTSHNNVWNPNSAELLSIPEPQGFSLRWQLSPLCSPLSQSSYIHRRQACRMLQINVEAETGEVRNRQGLLRKRLLIVAVWLEAMRMYQLHFMLTLHPVKCKPVNSKPSKIHSLISVRAVGLR